MSSFISPASPRRVAQHLAKEQEWKNKKGAAKLNVASPELSDTIAGLNLAQTSNVKLTAAPAASSADPVKVTINTTGSSTQPVNVTITPAAAPKAAPAPKADKKFDVSDVKPASASKADEKKEEKTVQAPKEGCMKLSNRMCKVIAFVGTVFTIAAVAAGIIAGFKLALAIAAVMGATATVFALIKLYQASQAGIIRVDMPAKLKTSKNPVFKQKMPQELVNQPKVRVVPTTWTSRLLSPLVR